MMFEQTSYFPKPGKFDDVLNLRRTACSVRRELGLRAGEIFVEFPDADGEEDPGRRIIHWKCQFVSDAERSADMERRGGSERFCEIRAKMQTLITNFNRSVVRRPEQQGSVLRTLSLEDIPVVPRQVAFTSGGFDLNGYLYLPPGEGPFPCMITNHGSSIEQGTTDVCRPGIASYLMSLGIASFLPHRRGYGNSTGTPWRGDVSAEYGTQQYDTQLAARLSDESDDVIAALGVVKGEAAIDPDHIGVMGSSFGGTVTLLAASRCDEFRCAVEFAGAAINWEKTPGLRALMLGAAARLSQPTFFIQAANDYSTRPTIELAASLEGSGKTIRHRVYPGFGLTRDEGHFFYRDGVGIWGNDVRDFLDLYL